LAHVSPISGAELVPISRVQALARTAVRCLAMQLMTGGFIHCDPHEGNLLATKDGKVALLDFGLMAQVVRRACRRRTCAP